jgi:hypothetical protein
VYHTSPDVFHYIQVGRTCWPLNKINSSSL